MQLLSGFEFEIVILKFLTYVIFNIDQAHNALFHQKLESLQYNPCLTITGRIRGSSREKLYQELGLEWLEQRHWYSKLCSFYKVFENESPRYLFNIVPISNPAYWTRNHANIPLFKINHNFFKISFFPSTIIKWNNLDPNLRKLMELPKTPF